MISNSFQQVVKRDALSVDDRFKRLLQRKDGGFLVSLEILLVELGEDVVRRRVFQADLRESPLFGYHSAARIKCIMYLFLTEVFIEKM